MQHAVAAHAWAWAYQHQCFIHQRRRADEPVDGAFVARTPAHKHKMSGPALFTLMPGVLLGACALAGMAAFSAQNNVVRLRHAPTGQMPTQDAPLAARAPVKRRSSSQAVIEPVKK